MYYLLPFRPLDGIWSYHPHIIVAGRCVGHIIRPMTQRAIEVVPQKPLLQTFPVENVQAPQFANFLRAVYLFQTNGAEQNVSHYSIGKASQTYQTNCPSTASDSPRFPFVVAHHFSSVQVGETLSNLRNRSLGFFLDLRNDCLSRRLMSIVRLEDTVRTGWTGMVYVTCNTDRGNVSARMGEDRGSTRHQR